VTVTIPLGVVQRFLVDAIFVVALAGLAVEFAQDGLGLDDPYDLVDLFSLSYERNIPTWLSSGLHGTAAILLAVIARGKQDMGPPISVIGGRYRPFLPISRSTSLFSFTRR